MYIFAFRIQNYRSFKDVWCFPNSSLNCIIGPNNSGKTTLISALSIVLDPKAPTYRDDYISQFDYHNCDTSSPITIDVWLDKHTTENDEIKTRAFDKFSRWKLLKTADYHPSSLKPVITEPLEEPPVSGTETIIELLRVQFTATWDDLTKNAEYQLMVLNEIDEPIEPFSMALRKLIGFNAISSDREPLRDISLSKKGVFSQFLDDNVINPHFRTLIEELEKNKNALLDASGVKEVVDRLKKIVASQVAGNVSNQNDDAVSITFLNSEIGKLRTESCFSIKVADKEASQTESAKSIHVPLEYQGNGIQNLFLIIALAEIIKKQTGTDHCIVTLEEPEQHLEPAQVKWVYSELCKCFNGTNNSTNSNQLFITSHSSALVGELKGADSLLLMPVERISGTSPKIINANYLKSDIKKSFERNRDSYRDALLAKYILIVEGPSELGFLPVVFRHLSEDASDNPFHLGLEIVNGGDKLQAIKRADELLPFNRPIHVLIDHDPPTGSCSQTTEQLLTANATKDFFISCWSQENLLQFAYGGDLEQLLTKEVPPDILLEAIKEAYRDPCHEFNQDKWTNECDQITDSSIANKLKPLFPQTFENLQFSSALTNDDEKRAYLLVLLHAPHSCKSVKEMRTIAEYLVLKNALPESLKVFHKRILSWIAKRTTIQKQDYVVKPTHGN